MIDTDIMEPGADNATLAKWAPVLENIEDSYTQRVTAQLLENQAKAIMSEKLDEATTTTQSLGTFQKFAFPLVRRVFPELIANKKFSTLVLIELIPWVVLEVSTVSITLLGVV